jgi:hypothetical protein
MRPVDRSRAPAGPRWLVTFALATTSMLSTAVAAAQAKVPPPSTSALPPGHPPVGSAPSKSPPASASALPPGHPPVAPADDEGLPPGHPPARTSAHGTPSPETPPEDASERDDALPPGTIVVQIRDKEGTPVPRVDVTLGILQQSVAKGESRRRTIQKADDNGVTRFDNLERGAGVAYRISVPWPNDSGGENATYAAPPFQLDLHRGQRVRLHVYPVTSRVEETLLGMQGIVYLELKDDVVQIDELFEVFNLGTTTWVPSNLVIDLPRGFKAFNAQREMSDTGFDVVADRGAKMRGTFGPGQHQVQFRYQVPYEGVESVKLALSLPPRVIRMRVIAEASRTMTLHVADFPNAVSDANQRGQRVLLTERQARAGEAPLTRVSVTLDNIPTEGSARWITVAITAATLALGIYVAREQEKIKVAGTRTGEKDSERARARLVAEIVALDTAARAGEIGPQAHARVRQALIDSLARVMAVGDPHEAT